MGGEYTPETGWEINKNFEEEDANVIRARLRRLGSPGAPHVMAKPITGSMSRLARMFVIRPLAGIVRSPCE
jgi:hypothetical protein